MHHVASNSEPISGSQVDCSPKLLNFYKSKKYVLVFLFCTTTVFSTGGCSSTAPRFTQKHYVNVDNNEIDFRNIAFSPTFEKSMMLAEILKLVGTPYKLYGVDSTGIDCSGFTSLIYQKALSINLPRSTLEQYQTSEILNDSLKEFGDLVFFKTVGEVPSHVGIYLGENLFAHASTSYGVTISSLESNYYKERYIGSKRIKTLLKK